MFSLTKTGIRALCRYSTAIVRPTISGLIVLARAHVLITVRSSAPRAATFLASFEIYEWSFFETSTHILFPLSLMAASYNKFS
jgi:hypothetical protein